MARTPAKPRGKRAPEKKTEIRDPVEFEPKTPLGFALKEARRKMIEEGIPFLSDEDLEREIAERRGGVRDDLD